MCVQAPSVAQRIKSSATRFGLASTVRTVGQADDAYGELSQRPADLVLADIAASRPDPVLFTRNIVARAPKTGLLFVGSIDPRLATRILAAGARGIIAAGTEPQDLVGAVAQAVMLTTPRPTVPTQRSGSSGLTQRELQVLRGMSQGRSNSEIGRQLFVSEDTVKTHARRLFRKLGARDRAHAVAEAFRSGLVS